MGISLYDVAVGGYLQELGAVDERLQVIRGAVG